MRGTHRRPAVALSLALLVLWMLSGAAARGAGTGPPVASFSASPATPLTGDAITFTSTSSGAITGLAWDLDADGQFNDGTATSAARAFATPGRYLVSLRVSGPAGTATQSQFVEVGNRPPVASVTSTPGTPLTDDVVSFAAAAGDPDGSVTAIRWDLDGDGSFADASGPVASRAFSAPGAYAVAVAVTDSSGATTVASAGVTVAPRPPAMLQPFPIVRLTTRGTRHGVRVLRLGVVAPSGSRISVRCIGRGCGTPGQVRVVRTPPQELRFGALEHRMRAGVVLEVRVTSPDRIGKYVWFRLRRSKPPQRVDLCLPPGEPGPTPCPVA